MYKPISCAKKGSPKYFHILAACIFILAVFSFSDARSQATYSVTVCSGTAFTFNEPGAVPGETYDWSFPVTTPGGSVSGASAQTGQTAVSQTLTNTTNVVTATATYSVTTSQGTNFNLVVTVNPVPVVANQLSAICSGSAFNIVPGNVPGGTTYTWTAPTINPPGSVTLASAQATPQIFIGQTLTNPTVNPANAIYTVTPVSGACTGNSFLITVTVNPKPVLNNSGASPVAICSGTTYGYTPTSATASTTINWSRAVFTGINNTAGSGAGNPNEILNNGTNPPAAVTVNYVFTLSANGCSNNQTIPVIVNPKPVLSSTLSPAAICSGASFNYTPLSALASSPSFTWSRNSVGNINGGLSGSGSGNVSEALVNSITQPISVFYSFSITDGVTGCVSTPQFVGVTVNPTPAATDIAISSCSGNQFFYVPANVPSGTLYSWTTPILLSGTTIGYSTQSSQFFVGQTLLGTGSVDYTVTPNNNGCTGAPFHVLVNVTSGSGAGVPLISNANGLNVCSGVNFGFTPNSTATTPTYDWTRFYTPGISTATSTGSGSIGETLTNSSTVPLTANYAFRTKDNTGCYNTQLIQVTVNPVAFLTSTTSPLPICSNATFNYTPFASVTGTSFSWTRAVFGTNTASSGSANGGNPSELLVNVGTTALPVTYAYTLLTSSGCSSTQNVIVSVNPLPVLSSSLTPSPICSGITFAYSPSSATPSPVFNWTRNVIASISNGAGSGIGNPAEVLVNTGNTAVSVAYNYTILANGCSNTQTVNVVVNPAPNVANQTATTCSNTSLTVTPTNVPVGTQYTWGIPVSSPLGSISGGSSGTSQNNITQTSLANGTANPATATYTVTPVANGCSGSPFTLAVNVSIISTLSSSVTPLAICSNTTFNYTPVSSTAGTSFSWTRNPVSGISNAVATGTGNPNEILVNTTSNAVSVPYTYALNTPDGCVSSQTVTISIKPLPTLSSAQPPAICSGTIFNYAYASATVGTSFSWSRAVLASISNGAASGTNNPAEVLVNTTANSVVVPYAYILTAGGCSNPQTVNLLVKPTPNIPDQVTSSCNNTAFNVSPANVPAGTVYTWTQPTYSPAASIANGSAQPIAQNTISQTLLINTTSGPATATYAVTPAANGCTGNSFLVTVTVNIATVLSTSLAPPAVCSNAVFNYNPASNTPGTSFSWTRATVPGISNTAAAGVGNPNEKLINITTDPVPVSYTYALNTPNACLNTQTVTVVINPSPILTSTLNPAAICSGTLFNYTPASATIGVSYSWNRTVQPAISNGPGAGSGPVNPSELLVNTTINPITVAYNYTLTANSCTNTQTVNAIVNPTPAIGNQTQTICGNTVFNVNPVNIPTATQYTWNLPVVNPAGAIGGTSAQGVPQNNIGQLLSNQTFSAAIATYTVTPVANGCVGASFTAAVTVNPTPVIANQLLNAVCSGTAFSYTPGNVPTGTSYTWGVPVLGPVNGLTGGSAQPINQALISQTLSSSNNIMDTATYIVLPSTAGCAGNTFALTVPVKPVAVVTNVRDTICTGATFSVIPTSAVPLNTTYTWGAPVSVPFGSVVGGQPQATAVPVISQTLFNSSNAIAQMVYTVTPSTAGCAGNPFTLTETVGIVLAPVANRTATICSGTMFDVTPTTTPPNTTYTWGVPVVTPVASVSGSSAVASRQTIVGQTLTNLTGLMSSVVYRVVPFNTGCSGTAFTATINVRPVPKAAITGKAVVCRYPFDTLTVSFAGQAPWSFNYLDNNVPKTQTGITASPFTWIVPAIPNAPTRTLSITYVNDFACVDSTDTVTFVQKVNPLPVGQIVSLHGQYLCNGIPDTLFVSYPSTDTLTFQWTLNGLNLPGITSDSIVTPFGGRYNTILTNQYGCIDTAAASAVLTVISQPKLNFNYDFYCVNTNIRFANQTDTTFTGPIQWLWDMGDSTTRNTYHANVIYTGGGSRHVRLSATQLYCPAYTTYKDTTLNIEYPIPALRRPSVSAYKNNSTPISERTIPGYRYLWTPTRGIDLPDSANVNFNYQFTQDYVINLISQGGCITYDSLLVRVFDDKLVDIFVPKSFTPNNDGINDILYPYLTGIKQFQYFKVFNRFGKLLFETTNPDAGWNGSFNGTAQPMGIYVWFATGIANDGSIVKKQGEILLLR